MNKMNQSQTRSPRKRLLSLLLAVVLMIGLLPISAFASNTGTQADDSGTTAESQEFLRIFHLDCGRKYFTVKEIEGIIDQLAANHYTHIQLAFGNDGLRFLLKDMSVTVNGTTYDSEKVTTAIKNGNSSYNSDTSAMSGELSQDDMDAIIAYANGKGIQVIPMFNAPGHMYTVVKAKNELKMGDGYEDVETYGQDKSPNWAIKPTDGTAVAFAEALLQKYAAYFAGKGSTMFNVGADESGLSSDNYLAYAKMVNEMNAIVKSNKVNGEPMKTLAYNDGIYHTSYSSALKGKGENGADFTFDTDIIICYWTDGKNLATVETLLGKGFEVLNNTNNWYYVLGDFLFKIWAGGQWGYNDALNGIKNTPVTQMKDGKDYANSKQLLGSILCVWCDGPSVGYNDNGYSSSSHPSAGQTNKESVYNLIAEMATRNPDYFKETKPELSVGTAQGVTVSATKDGNYQVILPENGGGTVQLSLVNLTAEHITWTSGNEDVAKVDVSGLVTFTGKTGTVTITATVPSATGAESAAALLSNTNDNGTATYSVTFEVKAAGELPVEEITIQEGRTYDVTLKGNWVGAVKNPSNDCVQVDAVYNQTAEKELQAVTEIESGEQYLIVNQRLAQSKNENQLLTSGPATWTSNRHTYDVLSLRGVPSKESVTCWKITASNGGYTVQDTDGKYLNIGNNTASVGISSVLTLSYTTENGIDGATGGYWNISSNGSYYLNNLGETTCAGGWKDGRAPTDAGSKWTLYRIVEKTAADTTTVTFKGLKAGDPVDVTIGDTIYRITVTEKKNVEIPISIIDYRADGLLFDWNYTKESYAYGLVHVNSENGSYDFGSITYGQKLDGSLYGTKIPRTTLERTRTTGDVHASWNDNVKNDNSWSRAGLVQKKLGSNGMPVYTEATIEYVASLLAAGNYNDVSSSSFSCNTELQDTFLKSTSSRKVLNTSTTAFSAQFEVTKAYADIKTAYDLAWYLLNNLYEADTNMTTVTGTDEAEHQVPIYGMAVDAYKSIVLTDNGTGTYSFEAGYSGTKRDVQYNRESGTIYNGTNEGDESGFYPLEDLGYEQSGLLKNTSIIDGKRRNGNFTLRGESQFVYNSADDLYFTFTGDDDVYMYINGVLALDLGGAHGRNTKTVKLNSLDKDTYNLKDGEVATFTFFYMERCSDASTFGIETNMELVQRDIAVEKNAYSDSGYKTPVASGAVVDNGRSLFYDLVVTNLGNTTMTDFTFEDTDTFTGKANLGFGVTDASVTAGSGQVSLSANGYTYFVTDADGNQVGETKTCDTLDALSTAVAGVNLAAKQSLHVRFLKATVDVAPSKIISYTNTIKVTASAGGARLWDDGSHSIYAYNDGGTARTYVVDFGLPLNITKIFDPSAKDYINGAAGNIELKQQPQYGTAELTANGYDSSVRYQLKTNTTIDGQDTITLNVPYKFDNAERTLPKTLNIIPASNVYYEDSLASFAGGKGVAMDATWSTVDNDDKAATEKTDVYQALQQLGDKKIYGYDDAYNKDNSSKLSMGTAHKVTVTSAMADTNAWKEQPNSAWPTASFTFTGTGFDIISLTDNTSGAILVKVTGENYNKNFLVDNYYGYNYNKETGEWTTDKTGGNNALYQIPVMKVTDLPHGTYNVTIQVFFNEFFDGTESGTYNFWLDAIRIYNPMGDYADYTKDNEGYPQYIQLHDELVKTAEESGEKKLVFIDGAASATIAEYANYGPNNEVYLANGQAISFKVPTNDKIASIQIGAKAPKGTATMTVKGENVTTKLEKPLETATEMYYDITAQAKGGQLVTISNTSGSILSLTNLKITYKDKAHEEVKLESLTAEEQTNAVAMVQALFAAPVETFSPETFQADWGRAVRAGKRATLTVKTSADVESITVDGVTVTSYTTRTERTGWGWWSPKVTYHVFTYTTTAPAQTTDYAVCAVNAEGTASEPITATLTVRPATWWNWWF